MSIILKTKNSLRLVPIKFVKAGDESPQKQYPDIDDRGYRHKVPTVNGYPESKELRGPVLGASKGETLTVKLVRQAISEEASLFIRSSDEEVLSIVSPSENECCEPGPETEITFSAGNFSGSTPRSANIEVRFESLNGPVIGQLTVYVFAKLNLCIQPFLVSISDAAGVGAKAPNLDVDKLCEQVSALWAPCGVDIDMQMAKSFAVRLSSANVLDFSEINKVFSEQWEENAINVYIVQEIKDVLGLGISRAVHKSFGLSHPGIFLGLHSKGIDRSQDVYWCANDLAHELGHFFGLRHPSDKSTQVESGWEKYDTWSMRMLMHNYNTTGRQAPPKDSDWPAFNDLGYGETEGGEAYRAGLINLKKISVSSQHGVEGQCSTARNFIAKGPTVIY